MSERIQYERCEIRGGRNVYTLTAEPDVTDRELVEYLERTGHDQNTFGTFVQRYPSGTATVSFYTD